MSDPNRFPPGFEHTGQFAPHAEDSLARLLEKAEGHLEFLRLNEDMLRRIPAGLIDERRELWAILPPLIRRAMAEPALEVDARLEANRVWAEELRHSAWCTVTACVHYRSQAAIDFFAREGSPEHRLEQLAIYESIRPAAMRMLGTEDLKELRDRGFLRPGE